MKSAIAVMLAAAVCVAPAVGAAQQPTKTEKAEAKASKMARGDHSFLKEAAQHNMGEAELGQLASQRAATDAVKQFGQRMATDHGKALDEVKQLAQQKGVALPTDTDRAHKRLHDKLSKASGADFDREYMKAMASDHDKDVKKFQKQAEGAKDPDLKAWASKTLPVLKEHQAQAHQTYASVRGGNPSAMPKQK
jgi:putative membrane protein